MAELLAAIEAGDMDLLRRLLADRADPDARHQKKDPPLIAAVDKGSLPMVELLLEHGATIDIRNKGRQTPLIVAALKKAAEIAELLLRKGAAIDLQSATGATALLYSVVKDSHAILDMLLARGADPNLRTLKGGTPLMSAASNGEAYSARALISAGADINAKAVVGDTPLTLAIGKTADSAVAHLLLSQPGILFDKQCVAQVLRKGWDDVAALLLESSTVDYATPCQDGNTLLIVAAKAGMSDFVAGLLKRHSVDVNGEDNEGLTALYWAATKGHVRIVQLLLEKKALVNTADKEGYTALMRLACGAEGTSPQAAEEVVLALLDARAKADVLATTKLGGLTAAELAIKSAQYDLAKLIVSKVPSSDLGVQFLARLETCLGLTLRAACEDGALDKATALVLKLGAAVNSVDKDGYSPLMLVAKCSAESAPLLAEFLVSRGADIGLRDKEKRLTCIEIAAESGNWKVVEAVVGCAAVDRRQADQALSAVLIEACELNKVDTVKFLVEGLALDVDAAGADGCTGLLVAAQRGFGPLYSYLLLKGASLAVLSARGLTVLMAACIGGSRDIVESALSQLSPESSDNSSVLDKESSMGSIDFFDIDAVDDRGYTALMYFAEHASQFGDASGMYMQLVDRGADVFRVNRVGESLLSMACRGGSIELIDYLVSRSVRVKSSTKDGYTVLMFAVREAMNELAVRLLARRPSSLHETTTSNYTVLMAACEGGNGAMIRHLVEQGAKLNVVDDDNGYSALMYLARSTDEHPSIARMMVARGASLSAKSTFTNWTAVDLCVKYNNLKTLNELLSTVDDMCADPKSRGLITFRDTELTSLNLIRNFVFLNPEFAATYLLSHRLSLAPMELVTNSPHLEKGHTLLRGFDGDGDTIDFKSGRSISEVSYSLKASWTSLSVVETKAFRTPVPDMATIQALEVYRHLASASDRTDFFEQMSIQVAVDFAWQHYGRQYHLGLTALYCTFLVVNSVCNYYFSDLTKNEPSGAGAAQALVIVVLSFNSIFSAIETMQFLKNPVRYLLDSSNAFDSIGYALTYTGSLLRLFYNTETDASSSILAVSTLLLWINLLYYLRPYQAASAVTRMLYVNTQYELRFFVLVLVFILFGFSQALFLLSYADSSLPFSKPAGSYLAAFAYMMGQADFSAFDSSSNKTLGLIIIVLLVSVASIFMLNLLIAILSSSYKNIHEDMAVGFRLEKIEVMLDQIRFTDPKCPKYICCLRRFDDIGAFMNKSENRTRLVSIQEGQREMLSAMASKADVGVVKDDVSSLRLELAQVKADNAFMRESLFRMEAILTRQFRKSADQQDV